jgi:predicted nucleic acid-binding protein
MGPGFLIDTNIIIDFQTRSVPAKGQDYIAKAIDVKFIISFVSYIEVLGYKDVSEEMENFVSLAEVIELNKSIIDQTILLRKKYKIKLPDALIAATAIAHNLVLLSHNIKDFAGIKGLSALDPYQVK